MNNATESTIRVRVSGLRAGDYLPATKRTVLNVSWSGCAGYTELYLRRDNGKEQVSLWRSGTTVVVIRRGQQ